MVPEFGKMPAVGRSGAPFLRVFVSANLARWLRRVEALAQMQARGEDQRQWRLAWVQQFLIFLAGRQITHPGPADAGGFLRDCEQRRELRYHEQVEEAAALLMEVIEAAPEEVADSIRAEGELYGRGMKERLRGRVFSEVEPREEAREARRGCGMLARLRAVLRTKHYALRTEEAYSQWVRRFWEFHGKGLPGSTGR